MPIKNKDCEIKAIPELLKLLDIHGSTVTTDAIGTQTRIMDQIISQEGHFVLMVKKNQPQSYEEIVKNPAAAHMMRSWHLSRHLQRRNHDDQGKEFNQRREKTNRITG